MEKLFVPIVTEKKLHPTFQLLNNDRLFHSAKKLIETIAQLIEDKDGNFIEQFQSQGFDARLWEMQLHLFLKDNRFQVVNDCDRPDFHACKNGLDVYIEASLSSEKEGDMYSKAFIREALAKRDLEVQQQLIEYYIMRMGSVLFSKLNKRYWKLAWVRGKPLVLAITPAHNYLANFLPDAKIIEYLYGIRHRVRLTDQGIESLGTEVMIEHRFNQKVIPSNFFAQPGAENISAIIFTNNSGLHKFNRMGMELNFGDDDVILFRTGYKYNPTPGAPAESFEYRVPKDGGSEGWSESFSIFHNPHAIIPLDRGLFPHVRQLWLNGKGELDGTMTDNFVYHSITGAITWA